MKSRKLQFDNGIRSPGNVRGSVTIYDPETFLELVSWENNEREDGTYDPFVVVEMKGVDGDYTVTIDAIGSVTVETKECVLGIHYESNRKTILCPIP